MHGELIHSVIVGDSILLPRELVEYFENSQSDAEEVTVVVNRDMKGNLAIFSPEDWDIFGQALRLLNVQDKNERMLGHFFRARAQDVIVEKNEIYIGTRLSQWFRQSQNTPYYEVPVVMYINKNEMIGYEKVNICMESNYEKE